MKALVSVAALLGAAGLLVACAPGAHPPPRNPAPDGVQSDQYVWENVRNGQDTLPDTLVIVTASGGGGRAAALTLGVLLGMTSVKLPSGGSLADQVDVISSVSGGSVTAAYLALHGVAGLPKFKQDFVEARNMWEQLSIVFRPDKLLRLASPLVERSDVLIDHLEKIYGETKFADLAKLQRRPYLIVNGADLAEGSVFPFTDPMLRNLCSDLSKMKLSTAVAASAAFPLAYTPLTITNHCEKRPEMIPPIDRADWYKDPPQARWKEITDAYFYGKKRFVHVIDGGIADNLGISEPYRLLTRTDTSPSFKAQIAKGIIKKIIVVAINARMEDAPDDLDDREAPPNEVDELKKSVSGIRAAAANWTLDGLRILLTDRFRVMALHAPDQADNFRNVANNMAFITVDFDTLPTDVLSVDGKKTSCRKMFNKIPNFWSLNERRREGLLALGRALLYTHPDFEKAMNLVSGSFQPEDNGMTVDEACRIVIGK